MVEYVDAYKILTQACVEFCEYNFGCYDDIVAEIYTGVLGNDYVYCKCVGDSFEYLNDWYEGGELHILEMNYFNNVCDRAFHNIGKGH